MVKYETFELKKIVEKFDLVPTKEGFVVRYYSNDGKPVKIMLIKNKSDAIKEVKGLIKIFAKEYDKFTPYDKIVQIVNKKLDQLKIKYNK